MVAYRYTIFFSLYLHSPLWNRKMNRYINSVLLSYLYKPSRPFRCFFFLSIIYCFVVFYLTSFLPPLSPLWHCFLLGIVIRTPPTYTQVSASAHTFPLGPTITDLLSLEAPNTAAGEMRRLGKKWRAVLCKELEPIWSTAACAAHEDLLIFSFNFFLLLVPPHIHLTDTKWTVSFVIWTMSMLIYGA